MPWSRYDDELPMNKKIGRLLAKGETGAAALGLHLLCNTWSRHEGTAGHIEAHVPGQLLGNPRLGRKLAALLEEVRMFDVHDDGGWQVHDFEDYGDPNDPNPNRSAADRRRELSEKRAEAGRRGGLAKAAKAPGKPPSKRASKPVALPQQTSSPVPVPVPSTSVVEKNSHPVPVGGGGDISDRHSDIANAYARVEVGKARDAGKIRKSEAGYHDAAHQTALANPELARLAELFPTAPPDVIAAALNGEKHSLAVFPRSDEIRPNLRLVDGESA